NNSRRFRPRRKKVGDTMVTTFFRFHHRYGGERRAEPKDFFERAQERQSASKAIRSRAVERNRVSQQLMDEGIDEAYRLREPTWCLLDTWGNGTSGVPSGLSHVRDGEDDDRPRKGQRDRNGHRARNCDAFDDGFRSRSSDKPRRRRRNRNRYDTKSSRHDES